MKLISIEEILNLHKGHWFDQRTMEHYDTRLSSQGYATDDGRLAYFISSEQAPGMRRGYTIRMMDMETGNIGSASSFQGYRSRKGAHLAAKRFADSVYGEYQTRRED